jgi:hypothetical protein
MRLAWQKTSSSAPNVKSGRYSPTSNARPVMMPVEKMPKYCGVGQQ